MLFIIYSILLQSSWGNDSTLRKAYLDVKSFDFNTIKNIDTLSMAQSFVNNPTQEEKFEEGFEKLQMACFEYTDQPTISKCDKLKDLFFEIGSKIREIREDESLIYSGEDIIGINLDGVHITKSTIKDADPNFNTNNAVLSDVDRFDPTYKGSHTVNTSNTNLDLDTSNDTLLCRFENRAVLNLNQEMISALIDQLEQNFVSPDVKQSEKNKIFCTLSEYYQSNELFDNLDFLFLQSEGDLPSCEFLK